MKSPPQLDRAPPPSPLASTGSTLSMREGPVAVEDLRQRWVAVHPVTYPPSGPPGLERGGGELEESAPGGVQPGSVRPNSPSTLSHGIQIMVALCGFFNPRWWIGDGYWER